MPTADLPEFHGQAEGDVRCCAQALAFTILTAARSGEVMGMTWGEVDFDQSSNGSAAWRGRHGRSRRAEGRRARSCRSPTGSPPQRVAGENRKIGVRKQLCRRAEAQRTEKGQVHIWLEERWLDKLKAMRRPGESYSHVIMKLAATR